MRMLARPSGGLSRAFACAVLGAVCGAASAADAADAPHAPTCLVGLYRADGAAVIAVSRVVDRDDALRVSRMDGRSGVFVRRGPATYVADPDAENVEALSGTLERMACGDEPIDVVLGGEPKRSWSRVPLRITRSTFRSAGVALSGELIEPIDAGRPPLFVLVHGSEATVAIGHAAMPLLMASEGIAAFVFDKRGTGASGGVYTQDFDVLSDDAARAVVEARRLAGDRVAAVGLAGFSQGGWVAPAAAVKTHADFVVVGYGVAGTPLEQDAWQVDDQLRAMGFDVRQRTDAATVTRLTARVATTDFRAHLAPVARAADRFGREAWFSRIDGQYSGLVLRGSLDRARAESPAVPWCYDWRRWLLRADARQLWILAEDDSVAPSAPTIARLEALQRAGRPIDVAVFPATDHGIRTYRTRPDGTRRTLRAADGYLTMIADWMRGRPFTAVGNARIEPHRGR